MTTRPNFVVQLSTREKVGAFREGVGDALGIVVLGPETEASWRMAGIDAFYLSVTRAERWGSRPIPAHKVAVLRTNKTDQQEGFPPFVITGLLLEERDPNTAAFCIPLIVRSVVDATNQVNASEPGAIRTIGFFEFELAFMGSTLGEAGRLLVESVEATTR